MVAELLRKLDYFFEFNKSQTSCPTLVSHFFAFQIFFFLFRIWGKRSFLEAISPVIKRWLRRRWRLRLSEFEMLNLLLLLLLSLFLSTLRRLFDRERGKQIALLFFLLRPRRRHASLGFHGKKGEKTRTRFTQALMNGWYEESGEKKLSIREIQYILKMVFSQEGNRGKSYSKNNNSPQHYTDDGFAARAKTQKPVAHHDFPSSSDNSFFLSPSLFASDWRSEAWNIHFSIPAVISTSEEGFSILRDLVRVSFRKWRLSHRERKPLLNRAAIESNPLSVSELFFVSL